MLILLPHTLELVEDPYAVLREAERVLTGEGCLMICGFNPFSGWGRPAGVRPLLLAGRRFRAGTQRMLSERRLRDWVALLGFDVESVHGYLGFLPMKGGLGEVHPRRALTAGSLLASARKRVSTLTLILPRRRIRQRVLVGAAEPTNKVGS